MEDSAGPKIRLVTLGELGKTSSSFNQEQGSSYFYRGTITNVQARFDSETKGVSFGLEGVGNDKGTVEVKVKGEWAESFASRVKQGRGIVLRTRGGELVRRGKEGGKVEIVYEDEISGYFLPREVSFNFSNKKKRRSTSHTKENTSGPDPTETGETSAAFQTLPQPLPQTKPKAKIKKPKPPSLLSRLGPVPTPTLEVPPEGTKTESKKRPRKAVKAAEPRDVAMAGSATAMTKESVKEEKKISPPGEGTRSKKRRKQESKLDWNLRLSDTVAYTPLVEVRNGSVEGVAKHFVLVVVSSEIKPPRRPEGDPWFVRILVTDPSLASETARSNEEPPTIELQWYEMNQKKIPKFESKDILFARNFYVPAGKQKIIKSAQFPNPFLLLKPQELLDPNILPSFASIPFKDSAIGKDRIELSEVELKYAVQLGKYYKKRKFPTSLGTSRPETTLANSESATQKNASVTGGTKDAIVAPVETQATRQVGKLCEIRDIEPGKFCDIYAEVLKCYIPPSLSSNIPISLYVTDYTSNPTLMNYDTRSTSFFPSGRLTLQVSIFGSTQQKTLTRTSERDLIGSFIKLDNLRPKENNSDGSLECTLVDDQRYGDKELVRVIGGKGSNGFVAKPLQELIKRKREYLAAAKKQG